MSKNYYGEICKHCDIDKAKIKKNNNNSRSSGKI